MNGFPFLHWNYSVFCSRQWIEWMSSVKTIEFVHLKTNQKIFISDQFIFLCDTLSPSPQGENAWFVDERKSTAVTLLLESRSLFPRFTACLKQMGDSGNWQQGLYHAVMALSPKILNLYLSPTVCWSACSCLAAKIKKDPLLSGTQAHKVVVCLQVWKCIKPFA